MGDDAHVLGKPHEQKRMYAEAMTHYLRAHEGAGGATQPLASIVRLQAASGATGEARATLDELLRLSRERYVSPYNIATAYTGLGDAGSAFQWLTRACADRDVRLLFLDVEPNWEPLRGDPRFAAVERCVGLP